MTRRPEDYDGAGVPVYGDVQTPETLGAALESCDAAYYLVHSLASADFERLDAEAARSFAAAAAAGRIDRIVYLGGLGRTDDDLSPHLRSRREVERLLSESAVAVTTLRAGIVVGHGGISWELTRQLVARLPAMVTPRWVNTRTQPIAVSDVVSYLIGVLDRPEAANRTLEIGGPDVLRYASMMRRLAEIEGRRRLLVPVPLMTPRLSSYWLSLVTDVDTQAGRSLIESMRNEVVVTDDAIRRLVPLEPLGYDAAVRVALAERAAAIQGRP